MSAIDNDQTQATVQDELEVLKTRANMLNISYHPSIGLEKLREKVNAAVKGEPAPVDEQPKQAAAEPTAAPAETEAQIRNRKKLDAQRLIRIRVSCMNPAKAEWEGEFFSAGNALVGTMTKYVPFNSDEGWHVPNIIYKMIIDRQCQIFTTVVDGRGNKTRKGKLIKEFAVEVLPDLTPDELHDLAQRQAMSKSID